MNKIRIGVLGVSNHLIKRIILPLSSLNNGYIYGIASRDVNKAKLLSEQFGIEKYYNSYEQLIEDNNIDAVYIPLPNHLHLEWIKKAANKGKHILCEKPITLNEKEAHEALEIANQNNVLLQEAFMYKYHPQWIHSINIVKTNQIGQIKYIHTSFAYNNPNPENIRNIKDFGGGAIMDIGCYAISLSRFMLQKEPSQVLSLIQNHDNFNTDTLTTCILDFNGTHSVFTVSTLTEPNQSVNIVATGGTIKIHVPFNSYVDTKSVITISTPQGSRDIEFEACDQYGLMFEDFCDRILNKKIDNTGFQDAINNMSIIDAVFNSGKMNTWVGIK